VLGRLDHASGNGMVAAAGGRAGAGESIVETVRTGLVARAQSQCVVLDLRHRLDAAGDDQRGAPEATCIAASMTACSPEPQRRSICRPGTSVPSLASSAATRPMTGASPLGLQLPSTTSSTSPGCK